MLDKPRLVHKLRGIFYISAASLFTKKTSFQCACKMLATLPTHELTQNGSQPHAKSIMETAGSKRYLYSVHKVRDILPSTGGYYGANCMRLVAY
jgi:hypothetical protein